MAKHRVMGRIDGANEKIWGTADYVFMTEPSMHWDGENGVALGGGNIGMFGT